MNRLYFTKGKHSAEVMANQERELPGLRDVLIRNLQRVQPRAEPRTQEEALYRQRMAERVKPPSVKMAEKAERDRKMAEAAALRQMAEARAAERDRILASLEKGVSGLPQNLSDLMAQREAPPSYTLSDEEVRAPPTKEVEDLEARLTAVSKQTLARNLNKLFGTRTTGKYNIKVLGKLSARGIENAIQNAIDTGRDGDIDPDFLAEVRKYSKESR
jgi:hypothetical protein